VPTSLSRKKTEKKDDENEIVMFAAISAFSLWRVCVCECVCVIERERERERERESERETLSEKKSFLRTQSIFLSKQVLGRAL